MQRLISLFRKPEEWLPILNQEAACSLNPSEDEEPEYFRQILDFLREQKAREEARARNNAPPAQSTETQQ